MTGYLAVFEHDDSGWSVYVPDLPGCVSSGATHEQAERGIREAVLLHIEALHAEGITVPEPSAVASTIAA